MKQRDYQDTHRAAAPLKQAEDAVLLDTSELDFEQSLDAMKQIIAKRSADKTNRTGIKKWYYIIFWCPLRGLCGTSVSASGWRGVKTLKKVQTKGYILAPTHVSAIDPVFIVVTRWAGGWWCLPKRELFEINALLTWFFRCCGGVCVRGTKDEMAVISQTVEACKQGKTLLIFPEGTREKEGKLCPPRAACSSLPPRRGWTLCPAASCTTPPGPEECTCSARCG